MLLETSSEGAPSVEDFQIDKALLFAGLAEDAYIKFEDKPELLSQALLTKNFSLIASFNHSASNTQGFLARNDKLAVLSFRGTEQEFTDFLTDLKAMLQEGGHSGFFSAFESIKSEVESALKQVQGLPLYVVGHSLGGALAKVCVLTYGPSVVKACYTFGSPAICTKDRVGENSTPVFLVVNSADIVPRVLSLGPIVAVLAKFFLKVIRWVSHKFLNKKTPSLDGWLKVVKLLEVDTPKYQHFGKIYYLDDSGKMDITKDSNQSLQIFLQFFFKDYKKSFDDHSLSKYVSKIKAIAEIER